MTDKIDTEALLWRRTNEWFRAHMPHYPSDRDAYQAGHAAAKAEAAAPVVGRWYFVTNDGAATLCVDEADARESAAKADIAFPRMAPHRAVQLVPADQLAEARRDSERLDWIEKIALRELPSPPRSGMWKFCDELIVGMSLRAAIDAAKGEQ